MNLQEQLRATLITHGVTPEPDPLIELPPPPAVGIHQNVPFETYSRWPAIRHSVLEQYGRSAAHGKWAETHGFKDSAAKDRGSAAHVAILEPDLFSKVFICAPEIGDKRFKANKEAWEDFQRENADKEILTKPEWDRVIGMRDAVYSHPTASALLSAPGLSEVSVVWEDREYTLNGKPVLCKARLDRPTTLNGYSVILDLKTSRDARPRAMAGSIYSYGYHRQAAWYLAAANSIQAKDRKFLQLVVESEGPFAVAVYEIEGPALEIGHHETRRNLARYVEAMESGVFPAYDDGIGLIGLPAWAMQFHGEEA